MGILSIFKKDKIKLAYIEKRSAAKKETQAEPKKETAVSVPAAVSSASGRHMQVLLRPVITEKSTLLNEQGQYSFAVRTGATKQEVGHEVSRIYGVKVAGVNIMKTKTKKRRRGMIEGKVSGYRKAIVRLNEGETIDLTKDIK